MEKMMMSMLVVLVMAVVMGNEMGVFGSSSGPLCNMTIADFMECKPAVSGDKPLPPTPACCKALKGANIPCLCGFKNTNYPAMFGIDPNLALLLPYKCSLPPATCT